MEDGALLRRNRYHEHSIEVYGIKKMNWPPNLLDLNPIENLWKIVKDLLRDNNKPKNKVEMIKLIQMVWSQVSHEQLQKLISSMFARMQVVVEVKGGSTHW